MRRNTNPPSPGCGCGSILTVCVIIVVVLLTVYILGFNHVTPASLHMQVQPSLVTTLLHNVFPQFFPEPVQAASVVSDAPDALSADDIRGRPSLSAAQMQHLLVDAQSPVSNTFGQTLYDLGMKSGIDPVWALSIFKHESHYGREGMAVSTHSLGNIKCSPGYTCIGAFRSYPTWEAGAADWFTLMQGKPYLASGRTTIGAIIQEYAPSDDGNAPQEYAQDAIQTVARWRKGDLMP